MAGRVSEKVDCLPTATNIYRLEGTRGANISHCDLKMKLCASESFSCSWLSLKPTFVGSLFPQQWLSVVVVVVVARVSLWTRWRLRWLRWKSGDEGMEKGRGERRGKGIGREGREKGRINGVLASIFSQ